MQWTPTRAHASESRRARTISAAIHQFDLVHEICADASTTSVKSQSFPFVTFFSTAVNAHKFSLPQSTRRQLSKITGMGNKKDVYLEGYPSDESLKLKQSPGKRLKKILRKLREKDQILRKKLPSLGKRHYLASSLVRHHPFERKLQRI